MPVIAIFILFFSGSLLFAQVQIVDPPASGFETRIRSAVEDIWIIDTHEHLPTEAERLKKNDQIDFTYLFSHYANEDLVSASNSRGIMNAVFGNDFPIEERWELFKPFYQAMRNTAYGRVPLIIARDLFNISEINDTTYSELSQKLKAAGKPGWYHYVLKERAHIELSIQDVGTKEPDQTLFRHVERFDDFIYISSGTEIKQLGKQHEIQIQTLDDFVKTLHKAFQTGLKRGMIGVKSGLAYNRILKYDNVPEKDAAEIFNRLLSADSDQKNLTSQELKSLQDYMMHRVLDLANEFKMPVQIHTGLQAGNGNIITNSNPTHLINLFMEYPDVNFCIFHSSFPYGGELTTLAKNFPNVFIDMCWTHVISPSYSIRYLHEWLETVPANKIMAFGGDYSIVEAVYAHAVIARQVVSTVLVEKVRSGYLTEPEALDIANRILRENALEIFRLNGKSRDIDNLAVLNQPGRLRDWWQLHKTNEGFVCNWMVIGPFEFGTGLDDVAPPEKEINFDKNYPGIGSPVGWEKVGTSENGYLNFISVFNKRSKETNQDLRGMAYAYAELESPDARKITLTLGSNDGAKVWVNNAVVYNVDVGRTAVADQTFLEVPLKKGINKILVKVENLGASWGLYLRVMNPDKKIKIRNF
jgi:hypothetical protein